MGRRGIRGLKTRMGRECSISRQKIRLYSGGIHVGGAQGGSQSYERRHSRGTAPRVRAVKSFEFGEGKL